MRTEAQVFQNDDSSYLHWISVNPRGWILNVPRASGGIVLQHQSKCGMIRGARTKNWTGGHYYKVTGESSDALALWLSSNWSGAVRPCKLCLPTEKGPTPPQSRPATRRESRPPPQSTQTIHLSPLQTPWQLWSMGRPIRMIDPIEPQLASWDHSNHPNQQRLIAYLRVVREHFAPLLLSGCKWALSMTLDLKRDERLYRGNDVENYITPLVNGLGWRHFVYAEITKQIGGGSRIAIGHAVPRPAIPTWSGWSRRVAGGLVTPEAKRAIRAGLIEVVDAPLPPGPTAVHLAWRLSASRNWVSLWKPTGDAMGPVLGEPRFPQKEFHPSDDRITKLMLHRIVDDALERNVVDVGLWWERADQV